MHIIVSFPIPSYMLLNNMGALLFRAQVDTTTYNPLGGHAYLTNVIDRTNWVSNTTTIRPGITGTQL